MAKESGLWTWLKRARETFGPLLDMRRVENAVSVGDPDSDGVLDGDAWALELKVAKRPARASTKLTFGHAVTIQQVEWHKRRLAAGGACGFLIQVGDGPDRAVYAVPGVHAQALFDRVLESWLTPYKVTTPAAAIQRAVTFKEQDYGY